MTTSTSTSTSTAGSRSRRRPAASNPTEAAPIPNDKAPYRLPVVGTPLPPGLVEKGFWGTLVGAAVLGAVDPPLAALVGAGVLIARHRRS
jgi:hypothetical protein